jgi:deoxyribonuclease V
VSQVFSELPDLERDLARLLRQVPAGRVTTYGALAEALGNPIAARWVAQFVRSQEHDPGCPWHRVVRADGRLGQSPSGSPKEQAWRLRREGVEVVDDTVDVARHAFDEFQSDRPLERLRRVQEALVEQVSLRGPKKPPELIGGVDVSYPTSQEGVAGYALVELQTGRRVWSTTVRRPISFPYITTYLSFREIPVLLDLIEAVRAEGKLAEMLLVDGSGILHHRHAGIATHLGVVASIATIGVTKTLLFGRVDLKGMEPGESRGVYQGDRTIGVAIRTTPRSRRPIFVSPGHRVGLELAETVVRQLLVGHRLPEPLYWADRLSRAAGRK